MDGGSAVVMIAASDSFLHTSIQLKTCLTDPSSGLILFDHNSDEEGSGWGGLKTAWRHDLAFTSLIRWWPAFVRTEMRIIVSKWSHVLISMSHLAWYALVDSVFSNSRSSLPRVQTKNEMPLNAVCVRNQWYHHFVVWDGTMRILWLTMNIRMNLSNSFFFRPRRNEEGSHPDGQRCSRCKSNCFQPPLQSHAKKHTLTRPPSTNDPERQRTTKACCASLST